MAKEFYTSNTGASQTLNASDQSKIKIYDSKTDMDTDISNIAENEIVATKAGESEGVVEVVDVVEDGNPNPVSSNAVYDYVDTALDWVFAGRISTTNGTANVPSSAREIKIAVSNTGTILTASTISIPTSAITTDDSTEKITNWSSIDGTSGSFSVSGNNIVVTVTTIASAYVRVWYR